MLGVLGAKLLLIEADPLLAELTSFRLELLGYKMRVVATAAEAFAEIAADLPDRVITDTVLPDSDGVDLLNKIRQEWTPTQLPVLIFSVESSLDVVERSFMAGAQDFLVTPFDPTVLEDKIQRLLDVNRPVFATR